jgi:hypothetical protein
MKRCDGNLEAKGDQHQRRRQLDKADRHFRRSKRLRDTDKIRTSGCAKNQRDAVEKKC